VFRPMALCLLTLSLVAQPPPAATAQVQPLRPLQERLATEIQASPEMMANLTVLTDDIGPRPTGSRVLVKAHDFLEAKAKSYGLKVRARESWSCGSTWLPGEAKARLLTHNGQNLAVAQVGWTPATPGAFQSMSSSSAPPSSPSPPWSLPIRMVACLSGPFPRWGTDTTLR